MTYEMDQDLQESSYQATGGSGSEFAVLPFPAPVVYWKHGDANAVPDENGAMPISHYGRWNCGVEDWDKVVSENSLDIPAPANVERRPRKDRTGKIIPGEFYKVYSWRYLLFAVVAQRSRWYKTKEGKNLSHVQVLAHLARKEKDTIVPTLPVVLSAKVFASTELEKLIRQWFTIIEDIGPKFAQGNPVPSHYFYMAIGTFGQESKFSGSHGTSTMPELFVPEGMKADNLPFVGNEIARKLGEMQLSAQEWVNDEAWLKPSKRKDGSQVDADEYTPENDDIPF